MHSQPHLISFSVGCSSISFSWRNFWCGFSSSPCYRVRIFMIHKIRFHGFIRSSLVTAYKIGNDNIDWCHFARNESYKRQQTTQQSAHWWICMCRHRWWIFLELLLKKRRRAWFPQLVFAQNHIIIFIYLSCCSTSDEIIVSERGRHACRFDNVSSLVLYWGGRPPTDIARSEQATWEGMREEEFEQTQRHRARIPFPIKPQ